MKNSTQLVAGTIAAILGTAINSPANATGCGDFGECKALIEINSTDGDIGFHFLMDADGLVTGRLLNPDRRLIFRYVLSRELREQTGTETFFESAEPPCFDVTEDDDPENDDEEFVTLADFLDRWTAGWYRFRGLTAEGDTLYGGTRLTFNLPAAPTELEWEEEMDGGEVEVDISWEPGDDLGECSDGMELLPMAPADVPVKVWEVVVEPDVDGFLSQLKYVVRIPGDAEELEVEVPDDYLEILPDNTPVKIEIGAIGYDDNATFTEMDEICVNETEEDGCGFDEEDEEG